MTWFTKLSSGVQYSIIATATVIVLATLIVFYKSKFKIKTADKEFDKEAPEDDGETK